MDHKIIYSRRNKYSLPPSSDLNTALITDRDSLPPIEENQITSILDNYNLSPNSTIIPPPPPSFTDKSFQSFQSTHNLLSVINDNDRYDTRTDSITTMRSDINTYINPLSETTDSTQQPSYQHRNNTRNNSFFDYIISPYDYFLFSISCVPVVVAISFSASVLPHIRISGIGNGGFFLGYAFCSLSISKSIVDTLGCKKAIVYGFVASCTFVLSFLIASAQFRPHLDIVYPIGATIGGISQAIMWTAQVYFLLLHPFFFLFFSNSLILLNPLILFFESLGEIFLQSFKNASDFTD